MKSDTKMSDRNKSDSQNQKIYYEEYHFSYQEKGRVLLEAAAVALGVNFLFYRSWYGCVLVIPAVPCVWMLVRRGKIRKQKMNLHYHFKDALSAILTALRAGYSMENAVAEACRDMHAMYGPKDCITVELTRMCHQMQLQIPVEELFEDLGNRSGNSDIETFAGVLQIAKRTGGNLEEILQGTWKTLSEKIETKQEIEATIEAKRYEQMIMSMMPAAIIVYLQLSFPDMLQALYHNVIGVVVMTGCLAVYAGAWILGQKIVEIKV